VSFWTGHVIVLEPPRVCPGWCNSYLRGGPTDYLGAAVVDYCHLTDADLDHQDSNRWARHHYDNHHAATAQAEEAGTDAVATEYCLGTHDGDHYHLLVTHFASDEADVETLHLWDPEKGLYQQIGGRDPAWRKVSLFGLGSVH
jgi:hypothetical protein